MGFNKRYFNEEMLIKHFNEDNEEWVKNAIGKTDCMIFNDTFSLEIISLWQSNPTEANKKMKEHVSRISSSFS